MHFNNLSADTRHTGAEKKQETFSPTGRCLQRGYKSTKQLGFRRGCSRLLRSCQRHLWAAPQSSSSEEERESFTNHLSSWFSGICTKLPRRLGALGSAT